MAVSGAEMTDCWLLTPGGVLLKLSCLGSERVDQRSEGPLGSPGCSLGEIKSWPFIPALLLLF